MATILGLALPCVGRLGVSSAATSPLAGSLGASFGCGGVVTQTRGFVGTQPVLEQPSW